MKDTAATLYQDERPYTTLDNHTIQNAGLSAEALGIWAYLASMPDGWKVRPEQIQKHFRIGKDKWQRIARELRTVGLMVDQYERDSLGKVIGRSITIRHRAPDSGSSASTDTHKPENPALGDTVSRITRELDYPSHGKPGVLEIKKKHINKEIDINKRVEASPPAPAKKKTKSPPEIDPMAVPIPDSVDQQVWRDWVEHKSTTKNPIKYMQVVTKTCNMLSKFTTDQQRRMADYSILGGYDKLFEDQAEDKRYGNQQPTNRADVHAATSGNWDIPDWHRIGN